MAINERKHHIKVLENLLSHYKAREKCEGYYDSTLKDSVEALQYAISSVKTDLKYDLMYENIPIITLDELKEIREEINNLQTYKLISGDTELYLSKDSVLAILDKKVSGMEKAE